MIIKVLIKFLQACKLIVRNYTSAGSVSSVDSFFYDASNKLVRVEGYNGMNVKQKTVTLAYNGDNTLNSGTVDYTDPLTNDLLLEYTYSGGNATASPISCRWRPSSLSEPSGLARFQANAIRLSGGSDSGSTNQP